MAMRKYTTCCLLKIWARFFGILTEAKWYHFDTNAGYVSAFETKSFTSLRFLLRRLHRRTPFKVPPASGAFLCPDNSPIMAHMWHISGTIRLIWRTALDKRRDVV